MIYSCLWWVVLWNISFMPRFCTARLYWAGTTWANEMNFVMNHASGAGLITRPVGQQSSGQLLCYEGCIVCKSLYLCICVVPCLQSTFCNNMRLDQVHYHQLNDNSPICVVKSKSIPPCCSRLTGRGRVGSPTNHEHPSLAHGVLELNPSRSVSWGN